MDAGLVGIFVTVAIAHFLALLSPGPDFVIVVKSAVRNKGKKALGVAFGIASANAVYIALCLVGVGSILAASVSIMIALKIIGGVFLVYLAVQAIRAKKCNYSNFDVDEEGASNQTTFLKEFLTGFLSGILNPKNLLFYLSLFTVVLNNDVGFIPCRLCNSEMKSMIRVVGLLRSQGRARHHINGLFQFGELSIRYQCRGQSGAFRFEQ